MSPNPRGKYESHSSGRGVRKRPILVPAKSGKRPKPGLSSAAKDMVKRFGKGKTTTAARKQVNLLALSVDQMLKHSGHRKANPVQWDKAFKAARKNLVEASSEYWGALVAFAKVQGANEQVIRELKAERSTELSSLKKLGEGLVG